MTVGILDPMAAQASLTRTHLLYSSISVKKAAFSSVDERKRTHFRHNWPKCNNPCNSIKWNSTRARALTDMTIGSIKWNSTRARALTDMTIGSVESEKHDRGDILIKEEQNLEDRVDYNWETEWYPLYLAAEVPKDAPLGLTVFHKQIVLFEDGNGALHCFEDRCPHRLAKLSEGQVMDGRLECLYHGWQFEGDGKCVKIPQLPSGATIPRAACVKSYEVKVSQGVVWVWMANRSTADPKKIPWFEHYARHGFFDISSVHELPYDHSILLENLMDPAHIPISHDRTDLSAKRENAQALAFKVTERTARGFAGQWGEATSDNFQNKLRFEAPCVLRNDKEYTDKEGNKQYFSALFLCRSAGQGKSMLIVRFGGTQNRAELKWIPMWVIHQTSNKVFEQDMGFLSSQNEVLLREKVPTRDLYLSLKSCDTWVTEYRKWLDRVGHGMPYYFGHQTFSLPRSPALLEAAPAGLVAANAASAPTKGGLGTVHSPDPTNRYFRHVIHCKECRLALKGFQKWKTTFLALGCLSCGMAILLSLTRWRLLFLVSAFLSLVGFYVCSRGVNWITTNFVRLHRT
ncbi:hypothetical protein SUGI_0238900 [Cryptomeria japonica]|uniref:protein TIC 55, chloroplastic n=1 Tax=Cryptomeria japonica TaxID=3369 RepID=UPI002408C9FD|nr:protein TIC 55, chloroplastic [Cryptomeria japonica]GLJ14740.1 hypothetical protein SUGI_0238900 [Cryptomeria japonica]